MNTQKHYHGWLIELNTQRSGYSFHCWLPPGMTGVSDRKIYSSPHIALAAAQRRADLEAVKLALRQCHATFQHRLLDFDEYHPWHT